VAEIPDDLRYTTEHEWVRVEGGLARIGITDFAQDALGDIVYVSLPEVGAAITAGQPVGEVESTKSVSDLYAPVTGRVVECNELLDAAPETVNSDPYGQGWLMTVEPTDAAAADGLLDSAGYLAHISEQ
jgi:glycine cleavage system H protein